MNEYPKDSFAAYLADLEGQIRQARIELAKWRVVALVALAGCAAYAVRVVVLLIAGA